MAAVPAQTLQLQDQIDALARQLDDREKIWASGYLAGLAAVGQSHAHGQDASAESVSPGASAPAAAASAPGKTFKVWYGSETGNARRLAEGLAADAAAKGLEVELSNLADVRPHQIRKESLIALVVSTHGEGEPPEDAEALHEFLHSERAPRLDGLSYAVFSLGDSSYEYFCQTGKDLDQALSKLGARSVLNRVDADVDFESQASEWREQALQRFSELSRKDQEDQPVNPANSVQSLAVASPASDKTPAGNWTRDNPFEAEVLASQPLTVSPSNKQVHHVELSIEGSGIQYQAGDSVGIWTDNAPELVEEILEQTGLSADEVVDRLGDKRPLGEWLSQKLELTQISRPFIEAYARGGQIAELEGLLSDAKGFRRWLESRQLIDVLREYPLTLTATQLVGMLRPITPRLYSIASSPSETPEEIHLTVKTLGGRSDQGLRAGAASWLLNHRLEAGQRPYGYSSSLIIDSGCHQIPNEQ